MPNFFQAPPSTVIVIEYREQHHPDASVLAHVASTWETAEEFMRNNTDYGGTDINHHWWCSHDVIDEARLVHQTLESRTYDKMGMMLEASVNKSAELNKRL